MKDQTHPRHRRHRQDRTPRRRQPGGRGLPVRRGSRSSATPFDWEAPETWAPALRGARAAYVTYFPDLAFPGAVEKLESLCETAQDIGVEHLVLLSGRGEHHARLGEEVVRNSGVDFTIVRAAWFAQNFSEGYLRDPVLAGVLPMPGGDIAEPIIDIDDIADVAVAALTEEGHKGELYEVTGPRLMTFADMAAELSRATGRPIRHIPISFEEFHANIARGWRQLRCRRLHRHRARNAGRAQRPHHGRCDARTRPGPPRLRRLRPGRRPNRRLDKRRLNRSPHRKDHDMKPTRLEKIALGLAGLTALTIGAFILFCAARLLRSYGITLGGDASLLSELRAPGAGLAAFGLVDAARHLAARGTAPVSWPWP